MALKRAVTRYGKVEGVSGRCPEYTVFRGIPYAKPPVGAYRWRAPEPPEPWEGVYPAGRFKGICPQVRESSAFYTRESGPNRETLTEDCLYLNIWTPAKSPEEKLPVILWIHGGANVTGFGHETSFDGEGFCRRGVLLVTFNWRVNIFGWMVSRELMEENDRGVCGNYGVLDQIAALRFVRENISAFGGDPENITIAGESAGASAVMNLCSTPLTAGMFRHAVMESGGGFDLFTSFGMRKMEEACEETSLKRLLKVETIAEARQLSAEELICRISRPEAAGAYLPMPVVDGYVFPKSVTRTALDDECSRVDYIIGYNGDETHMYEPDLSREHFLEEVREEYGAYAEAYLSLCEFMESEEAFAEYRKYQSAEILKTGAAVMGELMDRQGHPVYLYCFERKLPGDDAGAYHSADLWYVFQTMGRNWRTFSEQDYRLSEEIADRWAAFAKTGTPNTDSYADWRPYTREEPMEMVFDGAGKMRALKENARVTFRKDYVLGQHADEKRKRV